MKCPICGTELDSKFRIDTCPICGSAIDWVEEPEPVEEPVEKPKKQQVKRAEEPDPYSGEPIEKKTVQKKPLTKTAEENDPYYTGKDRNTGKTSGKMILTAGIAGLLLVAVIEGGIIIKNTIADKKDSNSTEYAQYEDEDNSDGGESLVINNTKETDADAEAAQREAEEKAAEEAAQAAQREAEEKAAEEQKAAEEKAKKEAEEKAAAEKKAEEEKATATVSLADYGVLNRYSKARITGYWASSVVQDNPGYDNGPRMMVDGDETSSWQEGAPGDGTGETVKFDMEQKCKVQYITFKMGNWRNQDRYNENHRPKSIRLKVGSQSFNLDFPDGKKEFMVSFSKPITAQKISLEITSTYKGSMYRDWQDCCISEMTVYKV